MANSAWTRIASSALAVAVLSGGAALALQQSKPPRGRAVVVLTAEGQYRFGDDAVKRDELPRRIADALDRAPDAERVVDLIVAEAVRYGAAKDVLFMARELGYTRIRLAVRRDEVESDDALLGATIFPTPTGVKPEVSGLPALDRRERVRTDPSQSMPPPSMHLPPGFVRSHGDTASVRLDAGDLVVELKALSTGGPMVALNGREMPLVELQPTLAPILKDWPVGEKYVAFKASADIAFEHVAEVMLEIEDAGAEVVFLLLDEYETPREFVPRTPSRGAGGERRTP